MSFQHKKLLSELSAAESNATFKLILTEKCQNIQRLLHLYRGQIIDSVELYAGQSSYWQNLRSRLLNLLGEKGLQNAVMSELERPFAGTLRSDGGDQ